VVRSPLLDCIFDWILRRTLKSNYDTQALTAFSFPFSVVFEWYACRQSRHRILAGEFDAVLRLYRKNAVLPGPFAFFQRKGSIPFVLGPPNGGLP
jgi:hypothetical protein